MNILDRLRLNLGDKRSVNEFEQWLVSNQPRCYVVKDGDDYHFYEKEQKALNYLESLTAYYVNENQTAPVRLSLYELDRKDIKGLDSIKQIYKRCESKHTPTRVEREIVGMGDDRKVIDNSVTDLNIFWENKNWHATYTCEGERYNRQSFICSKNTLGNRTEHYVGLDFEKDKPTRLKRVWDEDVKIALNNLYRTNPKSGEELEELSRKMNFEGDFEHPYNQLTFHDGDGCQQEFIDRLRVAYPMGLTLYSYGDKDRYRELVSLQLNRNTEKQKFYGTLSKLNMDNSGGAESVIQVFIPVEKYAFLFPDIENYYPNPDDEHLLTPTQELFSQYARRDNLEGLELMFEGTSLLYGCDLKVEDAQLLRNVQTLSDRVEELQENKASLKEDNKELNQSFLQSAYDLNVANHILEESSIPWNENLANMRKGMETGSLEVFVKNENKMPFLYAPYKVCGHLDRIGSRLKAYPKRGLTDILADYALVVRAEALNIPSVVIYSKRELNEQFFHAYNQVEPFLSPVDFSALSPYTAALDQTDLCTVSMLERLYANDEENHPLMSLIKDESRHQMGLDTVWKEARMLNGLNDWTCKRTLLELLSDKLWEQNEDFRAYLSGQTKDVVASYCLFSREFYQKMDLDYPDLSSLGGVGRSIESPSLESSEPIDFSETMIPELLYHGSAKEFTYFLPDEMGVFLTDSRIAAQSYSSHTGGLVYACRVKVDNPMEVELDGKNDLMMEKYIWEAKAKGYDALIAHNTYDGEQTFDQYVVFDSKAVHIESMSDFKTDRVQSVQQTNRMIAIFKDTSGRVGCNFTAYIEYDKKTQPVQFESDRTGHIIGAVTKDYDKVHMFLGCEVDDVFGQGTFKRMQQVKDGGELEVCPSYRKLPEDAVTYVWNMEDIKILNSWRRAEGLPFISDADFPAAYEIYGNGKLMNTSEVAHLIPLDNLELASRFSFASDEEKREAFPKLESSESEMEIGIDLDESALVNVLERNRIKTYSHFQIIDTDHIRLSSPQDKGNLFTYTDLDISALRQIQRARDGARKMLDIVISTREYFPPGESPMMEAFCGYNDMRLSKANLRRAEALLRDYDILGNDAGVMQQVLELRDLAQVPHTDMQKMESITEADYNQLVELMDDIELNSMPDVEIPLSVASVVPELKEMFDEYSKDPSDSASFRDFRLLALNVLDCYNCRSNQANQIEMGSTCFMESQGKMNSTKTDATKTSEYSPVVNLNDDRVKCLSPLPGSSIIPRNYCVTLQNDAQLQEIIRYQMLNGLIPCSDSISGYPCSVALDTTNEKQHVIISFTDFYLSGNNIRGNEQNVRSLLERLSNIASSVEQDYVLLERPLRVCTEQGIERFDRVVNTSGGPRLQTREGLTLDPSQYRYVYPGLLASKLMNVELTLGIADVEYKHLIFQGMNINQQHFEVVRGDDGLVYLEQNKQKIGKGVDLALLGESLEKTLRACLKADELVTPGSRLYVSNVSESPYREKWLLEKEILDHMTGEGIHSISFTNPTIIGDSLCINRVYIEDGRLVLDLKDVENLNYSEELAMQTKEEILSFRDVVNDAIEERYSSPSDELDEEMHSAFSKEPLESVEKKQEEQHEPLSDQSILFEDNRNRLECNEGRFILSDPKFGYTFDLTDACRKLKELNVDLSAQSRESLCSFTRKHSACFTDSSGGSITCHLQRTNERYVLQIEKQNGSVGVVAEMER